MLFNTQPKVRVHIDQTDDAYDCGTGESLLRGMLRLGRKGIPAGCVNGGCGVCKVRVLEGEVRSLGPVSRAHVSEEEEQQGYTLACRVAPVTPVRVEVTARLRKPFRAAPAPDALPPAPLIPPAVAAVADPALFR